MPERIQQRRAADLLEARVLLGAELQCLPQPGARRLGRIGIQGEVAAQEPVGIDIAGIDRVMAAILPRLQCGKYGRHRPPFAMP